MLLCKATALKNSETAFVNRWHACKVMFWIKCFIYRRTNRKLGSEVDHSY